MEKNKNNKFILIGFGGIIITLFLIILLLLFKFDIIGINENNTSQNQNTQEVVNKENGEKNEIVSVVESKEQVKTESQNTVSFKQMDYTDEELTEEQKAVALFFDEDFFNIMSYDELLRYADMIKNIKISCFFLVDTILSTTDEEYEAYGYWSYYYDGLIDSSIVNYNNKIIIKGKKPKGMILTGDIVAVKGRLVGAETRKVDGKTEYIPIIDVEDLSKENLWFSEETIRNAAKAVFGNNIKVRRPTDSETEKMVFNGFYTHHDWVWLVELENQSNLNFKVFDIVQSSPYGVMRYNGIYNEGVTVNEYQDVNKKLYVTPDLQKYIVFDLSVKDKYIYISVYDRQLNKLWQREISNVSQVTWDATNERLVFVSDNDFYNINIETGEDIFTPKYVGKRTNVNIVENGYILLSNDKDDAVLFLDQEGNIKNKYDLVKDDNTYLLGGVIQKLDNRYVIMFVSAIDNKTDFHTTKYIILDKDGNKLDESE